MRDHKYYVVCDDDNKQFVTMGKLPHIVRLEANLYLRNHNPNADLSVLVYDNIEDFANFSPNHQYVRYEDFK